jgi:hypothetical protein
LRKITYSENDVFSHNNQGLELYYDISFLWRPLDAIANNTPFTSATKFIIHTNDPYKEVLF